MSLMEQEESILDGRAPELHILDATPKTVHWGYFDAGLAPALRVKSGDFVKAQAITHHAGDAPDLMMDESIKCISPASRKPIAIPAFI